MAAPTQENSRKSYVICLMKEDNEGMFGKRMRKGRSTAELG